MSRASMLQGDAHKGLSTFPIVYNCLLFLALVLSILDVVEAAPANVIGGIYGDTAVTITESHVTWFAQDATFSRLNINFGSGIDQTNVSIRLTNLIMSTSISFSGLFRSLSNSSIIVDGISLLNPSGSFYVVSFSMGTSSLNFNNTILFNNITTSSFLTATPVYILIEHLVQSRIYVSNIVALNSARSTIYFKFVSGVLASNSIILISNITHSYASATAYRTLDFVGASFNQTTVHIDNVNIISTFGDWLLFIDLPLGQEVLHSVFIFSNLAGGKVWCAKFAFIGSVMRNSSAFFYNISSRSGESLVIQLGNTYASQTDISNITIAADNVRTNGTTSINVKATNFLTLLQNATFSFRNIVQLNPLTKAITVQFEIPTSYNSVAVHSVYGHVYVYMKSRCDFSAFYLDSVDGSSITASDTPSVILLFDQQLTDIAIEVSNLLGSKTGAIFVQTYASYSGCVISGTNITMLLQADYKPAITVQAITGIILYNNTYRWRNVTFACAEGGSISYVPQHPNLIVRSCTFEVDTVVHGDAQVMLDYAYSFLSQSKVIVRNAPLMTYISYELNDASSIEVINAFTPQTYGHSFDFSMSPGSSLLYRNVTCTGPVKFPIVIEGNATHPALVTIENSNFVTSEVSALFFADLRSYSLITVYRSYIATTSAQPALYVGAMAGIKSAVSIIGNTILSDSNTPALQFAPSDPTGYVEIWGNVVGGFSSFFLQPLQALYIVSNQFPTLGISLVVDSVFPEVGIIGCNVGNIAAGSFTVPGYIVPADCGTYRVRRCLGDISSYYYDPSYVRMSMAGDNYVTPCTAPETPLAVLTETVVFATPSLSNSSLISRSVTPVRNNTVSEELNITVSLMANHSNSVVFETKSVNETNSKVIFESQSLQLPSASAELSSSPILLPSASVEIAETMTVPLETSTTTETTSTSIETSTSTSIETSTTSSSPTTVDATTSTIESSADNSLTTSDPASTSTTTAPETSNTAASTLTATSTVASTADHTATTTTLAPTAGTSTSSTSATTTASPRVVPIVIGSKPLSDQGYGYKYLSYTPTVVSGTYSNLMLKYSTTYRNYQARRYIGTSSGGGRLSMRLSASAANVSFAILAVTKTALVKDSYTLNEVPLLAFIDSNNASRIVLDFSSASCGDLLTSSETLAIPLSTRTGFGHLSLSISSSQSATCSPVVKVSGVLYSSAAIVDGPLLYYAFMPSDGNLSPEAFASTAWRGLAGMNFTKVAESTDSLLIGDPSAITVRPTPVLLRPIALFTPAIVLSSPASISIGNETHNAVACTVADQKAFNASYVPINASLTSVLQLDLSSRVGLATSCYLFDSVDALQLACEQSTRCVGFTTVLMHGPKELPLCMYLSGSGSSTDVMCYPRSFYAKPSQTPPTCSVPVAQSGKVAVYIQQTAMATGSVVILINGIVAARCGGTTSFTNGYMGTDGRCGQWALCFAGSTPQSSTVSAVASAVFEQGQCESSFGVLVVQTSVDVIQVPTTTEVPEQRYDTAAMVGRSVAKTVANTDPIKVFVYQSLNSALDVLQTGFSCALAGSCDSSQPIISMSTDTSCQSCGGQKGFFGGSPGYSDRCSSSRLCGGLMTMASSNSSALTCEARGAGPETSGTTFTGFMKILANVSALAFNTDMCAGFKATVLTTPSVGSNVPVYPFKKEGSSNVFTTLLAMPFGSTADDAAANSGTSSSNVTRLTTVGPADNRLDLYYVQWGATPQTSLNRNSTQACVVDHSSEQAAECIFFVPRGSNIARVKVSQTDFVTKETQVKVMVDGTTVSASQMCGGSSGFGFERSQQERCDLFGACMDQYIYDDDTLADANSNGILTVSLPEGLRSHSCDYTAVITVEFARSITPSVVCPQYECQGERKCLPFSSVCDGIQDCAGKQDELGCKPLAFIPDEAFCIDPQLFSVYNVSSLSECRTKATSVGSSLFMLLDGQCSVVDSDVIGAIMQDPEKFLCPSSGALQYIILPDRSSFKACRSTVHCYSHGEVSTDSAGNCVCTCSQGYYGSDCNSVLELDRLTSVACYLGNDQASTSLNLVALAESLRLKQSAVSVTCQSSVISVSTSTGDYLRAHCSLSSAAPAEEYALYRRLLQSATWVSLNETLKASGQPELHYITARSTMNPLLPLSNCNVSASLTSAVCRPMAKGFDRLRLTVSSNVSAVSATVTLGSSLTPSSRRRQQSCSMVSTAGSGGCLFGSCDVEVASSSDDEVIQVTNIQYANATALTTVCSAASVVVSSQIAYGNEPTNTTATVSNSRTDFTPFLASGIAIFIAGAALAWFLAFVLCGRFALQFRRSVKSRLPNAAELSWLNRTKAEMLVRLGILNGRGWRFDRCASGFFVAGFVLAIGASVLVLVYATSMDKGSNFSVLYEEYSDFMCEQSAVGFMPRRLFSVPTDSENCQRMQSVGESVGVTYATGECNGDDGSYTVTFKMGPSKSLCRSAESLTLSSGVCLPLKVLDHSATRTAFIKITCSDAILVQSRIGMIQALTGREDVFVDGELAAPKARLLPKERPNDREPHRHPYAAGSTLKESTSYIDGVLVSQARRGDFDNDFDPLRIVLQVPHCTFFPNSGRLCVQPDEAALTGQMADMPTSPNFPAIPDTPIGQMFGGFGTSYPSTWASAAPHAHRYYGIAGTAFDIGRQFPSLGSVDPTDEDGYAVSLWLRADSSTLGFAYAVADAFENADTLQVYPVERLAKIIGSGDGGSAWFNATYRVYQSLFVNGPGKSLTFAYASPNFENKVAELEFSLQEIGADHVMNGQWHHIAVTFLVENNKVRAKLVVDGKTSDTHVGWSACVEELPEPISTTPSPTPTRTRDTSFDVPSGAIAKVFDHQTDLVTMGGVLVVGYFSGGVYNLRAHTGGPTLNTDLLPIGTQAIRDANPFPRTNTLSLGIALVSLAVILLGILTLRSILEGRKIAESSSISEYRDASETFYAAMQTITKSPTLFGDHQAQQVTPIRLWTALRWTNLNVNDFTELMCEVAVQCPHPAESLLLLLYQIRANDDCKSFSGEEWNKLVEADERSQEVKARNIGQLYSLIFGERKSDSEIDRARCAGHDVFAQLFGDSSTQKNERIARQKANEYRDDADKEMAGADNFAAAGDVDKKAIGFGASPSSASSVPSANIATDLIAPIVTVLQAMSVWSTSISMPQVYNGYFGDLFSVFSIDVSFIFPSVPAIITPLVQVIIGLSALGLVVYLLMEDDRAFETSFSQYVWRRDEIEGCGPQHTEELSPDLVAETHDSHLADDGTPVLALPLSSALQLDQWSERNTQVAGEELIVTGANGTALPVTRSVGGKDMIAAVAEGQSDHLRAVGVRCPVHPDVLLTAQEQTEIWPYYNRPSCRLAIGGQVCGDDRKTIFSCGHQFEDSEGVRRVCTYALCSTHFRPTKLELLQGAVFGALRSLENNGILWLLCVVCVLTVGAAYTPFMKTALMIVGCHPYYQCEFEECWRVIDQKFALAAFLSITTIVLLGVGYPLVLFLILRRRKATMENVFLDAEYEGRYLNPSTGKLLPGEWRRFVTTDTSALAAQYRQLDASWLYFPSIAIVMKILPLLPAIFIEPRTFDQRAGCAAIQIAISLFLFAARPCQSLAVTVSIRVAEVHQLLLLGLQNLDLVVRNDNNGSLAVPMVAVTIAYLIFSVSMVVATALYPFIANELRKKTLQRILEGHGLVYSARITLYTLVTPIYQAASDRVEGTQPNANSAQRYVEAEELPSEVLDSHVSLKDTVEYSD